MYVSKKGRRKLSFIARFLFFRRESRHYMETLISSFRFFPPSPSILTQTHLNSLCLWRFLKGERDRWRPHCALADLASAKHAASAVSFLYPPLPRFSFFWCSRPYLRTVDLAIRFTFIRPTRPPPLKQVARIMRCRNRPPVCKEDTCRGCP